MKGFNGIFMKQERKILNHLLVNVFNKILRIEEKMIREESDLELTVTEMHTIDAIGLDKERNMTEIADILSITVGTLTSSINRLLNKGYVTRLRDEGDRRVVRIMLSEKGVAAYRIHEAYHEKMIGHILDEITDEEAKLLGSTLVKISEFFKVEYKVED